MNNAKAIPALVAGIALLGGAHFWLSSVAGAPAAVQKRAALCGFAPGRMDSIRVALKGGAAAVLVREEGKWRISSPFKAEADEAAVMRLADAISLVQPIAVYAESELAEFSRKRSDFALDAPGVEVEAFSGGESCRIAFGSATPAGDGVFAGVDGDAHVYVMPPDVLRAANLPPAGFRGRHACRIAPEAVASFDLKRGKGSFSRFAKEDGIWKRAPAAEGETGGIVSQEAVRSLLAAVCGVEAGRFAWPTGAAQEPSAATPTLLAGFGLAPDTAVSLALRDAAGAETRISFGKDAAPGFAYALVQDGAAVAFVPASARDAAANANFTDDRLFPVPPDSFVRLSFVCDGTAYALSRESPGAGGHGGEWRMEAPVAGRANPEAVAILAGNIAALRTADVSENGCEVSPGAGLQPVKVPKETLLGSLRPEDLLSREMARFPPGSLRRISFARRGGRAAAAVFDREASRWRAADPDDAAQPRMDALPRALATLERLSAERVVFLKADAAAFKRCGLDSPQTVVAADPADDGVIRRNILLGYADADGARFAALAGSDAIYAIPAEAASRLEAPAPE